MSVICGRCSNNMSLVNSIKNNMIVVCRDCGLQTSEWNHDNEGNYVAIVNKLTRQTAFGLIEYANIYKLDSSENINETQNIGQSTIQKCPDAPISRRHYSRRHIIENN